MLRQVLVARDDIVGRRIIAVESGPGNEMYVGLMTLQ